MLRHGHIKNKVISSRKKEPEPEEENAELTSPPVNTESTLQEKKN